MENNIVKLFTNNPEDFKIGQYDCFENDIYIVDKIIKNNEVDEEDNTWSHIVIFIKSE